MQNCKYKHNNYYINGDYNGKEEQIPHTSCEWNPGSPVPRQVPLTTKPLELGQKSAYQQIPYTSCDWNPGSPVPSQVPLTTKPLELGRKSAYHDIESITLVI